MIDKNSSREEIYFAIMHGSVDQLKDANPNILADAEFMMMLAKGNGYVLQYADSKIQDNEEIIETACMGCPQALQFASPRLQKEEGFLLKLARKRPGIIDYIPSDEQKSKITKTIIFELKIDIVSKDGTIKAQKEKIAEQKELITNLKNVILSYEEKEKLPVPVKTRREKFLETIKTTVAQVKHKATKSKGKERNMQNEFNDEDMKIFEPKNKGESR